jgi:probable rRNA maturation factor
VKNPGPSSSPRSETGGFELHLSAASGHDHLPFLRRKLRQAHGLLNPPLRELSVALVGDRTMSRVHEQYLGLAGPTDVLSFELAHDTRGRVTAGEVVVCVPQAVRQARRRGHPERNEVLLYALHGMLHLAGHEDLSKEGYARMHATEDRLLRRLGVGRVFKTEARSGNGSSNASRKGAVA